MTENRNLPISNHTPPNGCVAAHTKSANPGKPTQNKMHGTINIINWSKLIKKISILFNQVRVRYGGIRQSSASPRPFCDGAPSSSVWPSPRQTPGPSCPYSLDRTPPDANMKSVDAPSAWSSPSDVGKKESDGRDPYVHAAQFWLWIVTSYIVCCINKAIWLFHAR